MRLVGDGERFFGSGCFQHFGAGSAFGILEQAVLVDDQRTPQRNHHENAQQTTEDGDQHDSGNFQIETENHDRGHGDAETERD